MCISSLFGTWYTVFWWCAATKGPEVGEGTAVSFAKAVHRRDFMSF